MNRFEIIVEINGVKRYIETYKEESNSFNYNVSDIKDIGSRNASYTKTIKIPETKNNRSVFDDIGNLSADTDYNPNKKAKCWVLVNSDVVMEGFLQFRKVYDNRDFESKEYEIVIYSEIDTFFKALGEELLSDSDFSDLDHIWNYTNVVNSWSENWDNGYYYPLIDYGYDWDLDKIGGTAGNYVRINQMFPATNVKFIFDRIFDDAGFSYNSSFLNDDVFKELYIPFNNGLLKRNTEVITNKFTVGLTASFAPLTINPIIVQKNGNNKYQLFNGKIPFNNETPPLGDPSNLWDETLYEFITPANYPASAFCISFDIRFLQTEDPADFFRTGGGWNVVAYNNYDTNIVVKRERNPLTGQVVAGGFPISINGQSSPLGFFPSNIPNIEYYGPYGTWVRGQIQTDILDGSSPYRAPLVVGEKVWVELKYTAYENTLWQLAPGLFNTKTIAIGSDTLEVSADTILYNGLSPVFSPNETIDYNSVIPINVKKRDFIMSIIKMFNLIMEPSKDFDRTFVIEPRDQYYESGAIKDWTGKVDINDDLEIDILGEKQNKTTIFSYKNDTDFYNKDYNTRQGAVYGEYKYESENEFINGENKIEVIFSPTPIVKVPKSDGLVIPKIGKVVEQNGSQIFSPSEFNLRILTRNAKRTDVSWTYSAAMRYTLVGDPLYNYTLLTTDPVFFPSGSSATHSLSVGDMIKIVEAGPAVDPDFANGRYRVISVISDKSVLLNKPWTYIPGPSGSAIPVSGLLSSLGADKWALEVNTTPFTTQITKFNYYPYLGHFDNPFNPSYDINFGQTVGLYYDKIDATGNDLYSVYYENMIKEINDKDSRLITASILLDSYDISSFRFNDKIFIDGQYYKVNKIMDYDPGEYKPSKVELIKSLYITIPKKQKKLDISKSGSVVKDVKSTLPIKNKPIKTVNSGNNDINASSVVVAGNNNVISSSSLVVGNNNTLPFGSGNVVFGNENIVSGENNLVVGSNNNLNPNIENTIVLGNGFIVDDSNVIIVGSPIVVNPNFLSASRDEVLNPFSAKIINFVSGSRDAVRQLGSNDVVNIIKAGTDRIL